MDQVQAPIRLLCFYAPQDEDLWRELENHLKPMEQQGLVSIWNPGQILPGTEQTATISQFLNSAEIIILLLSADFLAHSYETLQLALKRREAGGVQVVPVILRPCDWRGAGFSDVQVLPTNRKAVTQWPDRDAALDNVAQDIRQLALSVAGPVQSDIPAAAPRFSMARNRPRQPRTILSILLILALYRRLCIIGSSNFLVKPT